MLNLFNFIIKNVVRNWISLMMEYQLVVHKGLVLTLGRFLLLLYAYNGTVGLQGPEWIQGALNVLIVLFYGYG